MRTHLEVLARLFVVMGATGALTGVSFVILGIGTAATMAGTWGGGWSHPLSVLFLIAALLFVLGGLAMALVGRALGRRQPRARRLALALAVASLCLLPFGTALGVYAFWVLVNDDARREFQGSTAST